MGKIDDDLLWMARHAAEMQAAHAQAAELEDWERSLRWQAREDARLAEPCDDCGHPWRDHCEGDLPQNGYCHCGCGPPPGAYA